MPSCLIEDHQSMRLGAHKAGDFVEMVLHCLAIGMRHDDRRAGTPRGTDRAKQIEPAPAQAGADLVRRSASARGLVPRRAQRLVRGFFWPSRISSLHEGCAVNGISMCGPPYLGWQG